MSDRIERDRLEELLALEVTEGLDPEEARALERVAPDALRREREELALAAAAIELAFAPGNLEDPPAHLDERLLADVPSPAVVRRPTAAPPSQELPAAPLRLRSRQVSRGRGWAWLAAAAALMLAVWGWWGRWRGGEESDRGALESVSDLVHSDLHGTEDPLAREAGGSVEWSGSLQQGVLHIRGLGANDPARFQYQLWIFDRERDERYPVDGGVFDVPPGAGTIDVPIAAKLHVSEPTLFAITVEKPGGVVVSGRERIVLVAQISTAA